MRMSNGARYVLRTRDRPRAPGDTSISSDLACPASSGVAACPASIPHRFRETGACLLEAHAGPPAPRNNSQYAWCHRGRDSWAKHRLHAHRDPDIGRLADDLAGERLVRHANDGESRFVEQDLTAHRGGVAREPAHPVTVTDDRYRRAARHVVLAGDEHPS
jgi:hypothetical protein